MKMRKAILSSLLPLAGALALHLLAAAEPEARPALSRPDLKPADHTEKVKVFILMGQSNMIGMGDIEPADKPGTLTCLARKDGRYAYMETGLRLGWAMADLWKK